MAKTKDTYQELVALVKEREDKKNTALGKLYVARAEAQAKLDAALPKQTDALDDFDVDSFLAGSEELAHLPKYIAQLDEKIAVLTWQPFGRPFDTYMGKVAELSGASTEEFEAQFMEHANTLYKLCREHMEFTSMLNDLEHRWLCNPSGNYSNRSRYCEYAKNLFHTMYNDNHPVDGFDPFN